MANNSILGGSPLGLIGVTSYYTATGRSSFNGGDTRNVNVKDYNANKNNSGFIGNSLFSGYRVVRAWPSLNALEDGTIDSKGISDVNYTAKTDVSKRRTLHNNDIYDTSILNIVDKLSGTRGQLRPTDFAYLKNIGVYPNNRLMIARRFASPVDDNIMVPKKDSDLGSFATLISWVPENQDYLEMSFGEEWQSSEADFGSILTAIGDDIGLGKFDLGGIAGAGGNALPLPGFTEIFQRNFLAKLGLIENSEKNSIPAGNPNLIKESKRRKTIDYGQPGSGLKTGVNVKMICEYELKYISGIDPTIVWMDLLSMITRFGTSKSNTYGLSKGVAAKMNSWANDPNKLIKDVADAIAKAISKIVEEVTDAIQKVYKTAVETADKLTDKKYRDVSSYKTDSLKSKAIAENTRTASLEMAGEIGEKLKDIGVKSLEGLLQKYRVKILGVVHSLSGLPSTPWHITIGNPMRPTFCSGDMLVDNVTLKLGPTLAFNDLPSSITVEFNMTNARPWGMQEIMSKFNSGYLRTVDVQKTFYETNQVKGADGAPYMERMGVLPLSDTNYGTAGTSGTAGVNGTSNTNQSSTNNTTASTSNSGTTGTSGATDGTTTKKVKTKADNVTSKVVNGKRAQTKAMNKDANGSAYLNT